MALQAAQADAAGTARGVGSLLGSRMLMVASAYATYALVARALSTAEFGAYGILLSIVNVLNAVLGTGVHQALSRIVSREPDAAPALFARGVRWAIAIGALSALFFVAGAPLLAVGLNDASLTVPLMILALSPGCYAVNAVALGFLNGVRAFERQGLANAMLAVTRCLLVSGAAWLGYGLAGTSTAYVASGAIGAVVSRGLAKVPHTTAASELRAAELGRSILGFVAVALLLQLLLAGDLLLLKRLLPPATANSEAGLYTAAQTIARVPFFLLIAVSQNAYPRLARDREVARRISTLVASGLLAAWLGLLLLTAPLYERFIPFIYPHRYAGGGTALFWLLAGSAALTLAEATVTMLSSVVGARRPAWLLAGALLLQVCLSFAWIPGSGAVGAAKSTLVAATLAAVAGMCWLRLEVGTGLSARLLGAALPLALCLGVAAWWFAHLDAGALATLGFVAATYGAYLLGVYKLGLEPKRPARQSS